MFRRSQSSGRSSAARFSRLGRHALGARLVDRVLDYRRGGRRLSLEALEDRSLLAATIGANFLGSTNGVDSGFNPPDTNGAVGLNHYVELINGRYSVYDKIDGTRVQTSTLDTFWTNAGATTTTSFDPRVVFDHATSRWIAAAVDNARAAVSSILLAVSNDANPTLGWTAFAIDSDPLDNRWADFPQLGVDAVGVYLSTIMFDIPMVGANNNATTSLYSIPKADLLAGAPTIANLSAFRDLDPNTVGFRPYPVVDFGPDDGRGPFLSTIDVADDVIFRTDVTGAGAAGAVLGATGTIDVADFTPPDDADQPGAKQDIDTGDSRFGAAVFEVGNSLWGAYTIDVGGRSAIRWHQIDETNSAVLQTGTIADAALEFFYPSIAANEFGDVIIGFSGTSTAQFVSAYAVAGTTSGGVTTFGAPLLLAAGTADFLNLDTAMPPRNRWGDYSATSLDPANPRSFWTTQEFVSAADVWSTQITQIVFLQPESDELEPNNSIATATVLGSVPYVTFRDLSIHDAVDEDYFKITAHSTGKLVVRALFDHAVGNLDIEVLDRRGNVIATSTSGDDDEELFVPVVSQQMYFVRVFGVDDAVNDYGLEIENFAAPVPTGVNLDPASDTGVFNNDRVTTDATPTFFIQSDVLNFVDTNGNGAYQDPDAFADATEDKIDALSAANADDLLAGNPDPDDESGGIAVEVTLVNTADGSVVIGFADALSSVIPDVYRFTVPAGTPLAAGVYLVTARTRVWDGQQDAASNPAQATGRTNASPPLVITIESDEPPIAFGQPGGDDGLAAASDTGVPTTPATFADRITSDATPTFFGLAEAQATVRLYADVNNNSVVDLGVDLFLGQTTATPYGENPLFADGFWQIDSIANLNDPAFFPTRDGLRRILVTAEDYVGNVNQVDDGVGDAEQLLEIFLDTQGPRISDISIPGFDGDLFDPKPSQNGPTPLINSLVIDVTDLPPRLAADFLYNAIQPEIAEVAGNYLVVGDAHGIIAIADVIVTLAAPVDGQPATATIELVFAAPLPDDRYTLTILDAIVDPAGNRLDGESNADEPQGPPIFPSGDGLVGGPFIGRFTVDSRPEISAYIPQQITVDINGNFVWDPAATAAGGDATNVDLTFTMQVRNAAGVAPGGFGVHDLVFAGKFFIPTPNGLPAANRFDQLAVYGNAQDLGSFRWLIDLNSDGVVNTAIGEILTLQPAGGLPGNFNIAGALPVAGNFDGSAANGDEIGLYNAGRWALDSNRNFVIDAADTFITNNLLGHPIVGDFDGDALDDLAVFNNNVFSFDLAAVGGLTGVNATLVWGFPGVLDRPVAADMDRDGIDDIGLWVPRTNAQNPEAAAEWYFLLSNDFAELGVPAVHVPGTIATLNHPFTPVPFGFDLYAEFGNERALPLVGNFDPPVAPATQAAGAGDFDGNGVVDGADFLAWQRGPVTASGLAQWSENYGTQPAIAAAAESTASSVAMSLSVETAKSATVSDNLTEFNQLTIVATPSLARTASTSAARRVASGEAVLDAALARSSWLRAKAAREDDGPSGASDARRRWMSHGDSPSEVSRDFECGEDGDPTVEEWDEAMLAVL